uniref:dolichyl-phosphate-mannose--protein mannosyltransferase n=1 Tax=Strigamia maritima TaxID=126957 RepID=T1J4V1_STRMM
MLTAKTIIDHNRNTTTTCSSLKSPTCRRDQPCRDSRYDDRSRVSWTWAGLVVAAASVLCFANSIDGQFVFDDSEAIVNNGDLKADVPWWNTFKNDFWGTRLTHNTSHKSYRPLTVLSFRMNALLSGGLHPWSFHVTNVLLHAVVSVLTLPVFAILLGSDQWTRATAFVCALLFAVHPVHTESVAGVVGRADLLCALFFFLAFLVYARACQTSGCCRPSTFSLPFVLVSLLLCGASMLCKEQGVTVIGLCSAYDIIIICRVDFIELLKPHSLISSDYGKWSPPQSPEHHKLSEVSLLTCSFGFLQDWVKPLVLRHVILLTAAVVMISARWHLMGSSPPTFQEVDNPASFANTFYERTINYNYLYSLNAWLLLAPVWLCFDWSMGCVPLIKSVSDMRILAVLLFWLFLCGLILAALFQSPTKERSIAHHPFSTSIEFFFRVGFVIAERVLYIPSAGFCLLVALGIKRLCLSFGQYTRVIHLCLGYLVFTSTLRCFQRSAQWHSEEILFKAGAQVCPLNAKVHYNIAKNAADAGFRELAISEYQEAIRLNPGYDQAMNNLANILKDQGELQVAERLLEHAISIRSDFAAAWMNLGIVQASLKKYHKAETSYLTAIQHRRRYPDCYYNLGNLYLDVRRFEDAYRAWRNATRLKPTHTSMICILGELDKAETVALEALQILPDEPSLHFNLANALGKTGRYSESERHFVEAIRLNPSTPSYYTNLGVLYHRWKKYTQAEIAYSQALKLNPSMKSARDNLELLRRTIAKQYMAT